MDDGDSKEEPDFIETHCYWTDCDREFGNQDDLVKVSYRCYQDDLVKVSYRCYQDDLVIVAKWYGIRI
jgi:hypothetical protein